MKDLNKLINNVESALWEMQKYFNAQPAERINGHIGTCKNHGALSIYQVRCDFAVRFPQPFNEKDQIHGIANGKMPE